MSDKDAIDENNMPEDETNKKGEEHPASIRGKGEDDALGLIGNLENFPEEFKNLAEIRKNKEKVTAFLGLSSVTKQIPEDLLAVALEFMPEYTVRMLLSGGGVTEDAFREEVEDFFEKRIISKIPEVPKWLNALKDEKAMEMFRQNP